MCPLCLSKDVRRSRPRFWDFRLLKFLARPMRCLACDRRFYRWPWSLTSLPPRPAAAPPTLTAFTPVRKRSAAAAAAGKR
jgi:hypothetical protein